MNYWKFYTKLSTILALKHECSLQLVLHQGPDQFESETVCPADIKIGGYSDAVIPDRDLDLSVLFPGGDLNCAVFPPLEGMLVRV